MNVIRTLLAALAVAATLGVLPEAASANRLDDARAVFTEAEKLYAAGDYGQAADKYEQAYQILRSPVVFFNIAQARRLQFTDEGNYENLVAARRYYERFLAEADPDPQYRARAEANLKELKEAATKEAKRQYAKAEKAVRLSRFEDAIAGYAAAYELWPQPALLFNLAQAQRKQFTVDHELSRLAKAEDLILTYQREGGDEVAAATIETILTEIRGQRAEYQRRRAAEARASEPEAMAEARRLYRLGDGKNAVAALVRAEKEKGIEPVVLVQLYRLKGQAAVLAGDEPLAIEAFKRYLALEPAAEGVGLSEASVTSFKAAQKFWEGKQPMAMDHLPPGKVPPNEPVTIPVRIVSDPLRMIHARKLFYRREGASKWEAIALGRSEQSAKLPRTPLPLTGKSYRMEYYIVAMNEHGAIIDALGSATSPLAFLVTEDAIDRPPPIYKRWWFWAGAGAVLAGTIATIAIVQADGLPDTPVVNEL